MTARFITREEKLSGSEITEETFVNFQPTRLAINYQPAKIVLEYLVLSTGNLYHRVMDCEKYIELETKDVLKSIQKDHPLYFMSGKIK